MANLSGDAYGLTVLSPITNQPSSGISYTRQMRSTLDALPTGSESPMAKVPDTYLCRLFVLDNVVFQGLDVLPIIPDPSPSAHDALRSDYLVFECNFHGPLLEPYLRGMWDAAEEMVRAVWKHCVDFHTVHDATSFTDYIKRCQVETTFYFDGSNDESLREQLKGLYLKQELSKFAFEHQDASPEVLQRAFFDFVERTQPENLAGPTWRPGATHLDLATQELPVDRAAAPEKPDADAEPQLRRAAS